MPTKTSHQDVVRQMAKVALAARVADKYEALLAMADALEEDSDATCLTVRMMAEQQMFPNIKRSRFCDYGAEYEGFTYYWCSNSNYLFRLDQGYRGPALRTVAPREVGTLHIDPIPFATRVDALLMAIRHLHQALVAVWRSTLPQVILHSMGVARYYRPPTDQGLKYAVAVCVETTR